jgi:hypothetical protein
MYETEGDAMSDIVLTIPFLTKEQASSIVLKGSRKAEISLTTNPISGSYRVEISAKTLKVLREVLNAVDIE